MKALPRSIPAIVFAAVLLAAFVPAARAVVLTHYITQWGVPGNGVGQFNQPVGVAVDFSGNVYVTDMGNDRVQVFTGTGTPLFSFGGPGSGPGQFRRPYGIAINGGDVYVVDTGNYRVQKFDLAGNPIMQWGTQGFGNGKFQRPRCVAADGLGNVVVTDDSLDLVQRFNPPGTFQVQWGSTGNGPGQFRGPIGISTDNMLAFFVADSANHRIQQFNSSGVFQASWGTQGGGNAQFQSPLGITAYNGEYLVSDSFNDRMQKFDFALAYAAKWGVTGTGNSQFNRPHASAADGAYVYVADTGNNRIQKFGPRPDSACAVCASPPEVCCEALPQIGGPWTNALVGTRDAFPGSGYPYCVTIFNLNSAPVPAEDTNWASMTRYTGPGVGWNADSLGSVFGLTLDQYGNIFVAHTSCYKNDFLGTVFGGGAGAIYRINGVTGAIKTFCKLPNVADPSVPPGSNLPGLGNITYDCQHQQFFATNLEDGKIYRIQPVGVNGPTGTVVETFDPLAPDDGTPGWAAVGERLWGIQVHGNRVFYSVWALDKGGGTSPNEIRSVGLTGTGGFAAGSDQHEIYLPLLAFSPFSNPVADISFSPTGRMLLGERGIFAKTDTDPHFARVLEYQCSGGCWIPGNTYKTGSILPEENAEGGVDYDAHVFNGASGAIGRVWATTDAMHYVGISGQTDYLYGYQGLRPNLANGSHLNSMLIDSDGPILDASEKSYTGDIEAPGCPIAPETGGLCGQKFSDLNRNGVKDGTEPGLAGWTIRLVGTGGTYLATTDANGNYCFANVLNGNYTLSEIGQASWVQTAPPGGTFAVTILGGQTLTGYVFGNYHCDAFGPCAQAPPMMAARWPFDEALASTSVADVTHPSPSRNVAQLAGGAAITDPGRVNHGLCFGSALANARVPYADQFDLDFGTNSFAISVWVKPNASSAGPRMIVEKRQLNSTVPYRTLGWALYLVGQQCFLEIGTGVATQVVPGPTVPAGTWTQLAVSVDRSSAGAGHWFVDGAPSAAFDFAPLTGSVSCSADLIMGQVSPPFGTGPGFMGCIDDLVLFSAPSPPTSILPPASIAKVFNAGNVGICPEYAVMPQVTTLCKTATSAQVCFNICNNYPTLQSYHWSLAGLPIGAGCTVAGPTGFSPASGTVVVAPGACSPPICVTITRPAGLTAHNATSCFALTFVNDATGQCTTRRGTLRADNSCWCATPQQMGIVPVPAKVAGTSISIGIGYPCDPVASVNYSISAVWLNDDHADPQALRLNGLPPGTPVTGTLTPNSMGGEVLTVSASFMNGYDSAAPYEIVLDADTDGDGIMERLCGTIVESSYDYTNIAGVVTAPLPIESVRLRTAPNPFLGSSTIGFSLARADAVTLGVFDLNGRIVRSLQSGRIAAGEHRFEWDGRDDGGHRAPAGIYFVRLDSSTQHLDAKLVKLR